MRIGGLQHSSLIDYPGEVSAVIFTVGCNFRCPYCHNPELVFESPEREWTQEEVFDFLRKRRGVLPAVTVTGGEPTVHEDLPGFLRRMKTLGFRVKLDTNGTNPAMLRALIAEGLVDYVAMDIKAPLEKYAQVTASPVTVEAIRESTALLRRGLVAYEFRTTIVKAQLSLADLEHIGREIAGARRYYLQPFNPAKTLHPSFHSLFSYTKEELLAAAARLNRYVEHCELRA